jgi:hypothetical protein
VTPVTAESLAIVVEPHTKGQLVVSVFLHLISCCSGYLNFRCASTEIDALQLRCNWSSVGTITCTNKGTIVNTQPTHDLPVDRETAQADREIKHLKKTLGRLDIVFLIVAAVVSIEALGQVSGFGAETFTWTLVLAVFFLDLRRDRCGLHR